MTRQISIEKEQKILLLLARGDSIKSIAKEAEVSVRTVDRMKKARTLRKHRKPGKAPKTKLNNNEIDNKLLPQPRQFNPALEEIDINRAVAVLQDICSLYDLHLIAHPLFTNLARVAAEILLESES